MTHPPAHAHTHPHTHHLLSCPPRRRRPSDPPSQMQAHARSPSAHGRRAALVALAVIAAGCAEALLTKLDSVVPWLVAACKDADHIVREAACLTVSQLAQFLQPDILRHAPTILPRLLEARRHPTRSARSATRPPRPPCARGGGVESH